MFSYMAWSTAAIGGIPSGSLKAVNTSVPADFSSCDNRTCLPYWNETEVDRIYDVGYADVEVGNILASRGWEGARFNYQVHGRPYLAGRKLLPGHFPSIAILGTSHCAMYGPLLEELALEYDVSVGFLCIDGDHGRFQDPLSAWDSTRLDYLQLWNANLTIFVDFWAGDVRSPWWYPSYDFVRTIGLLERHSPKVVILGGVPTLPIEKQPSNNLFKNYVYRRYQNEGNFQFLGLLQEDPAYRLRRLQIEAEIQKASSNSSSTIFRCILWH
jgi:hypothetical protein